MEQREKNEVLVTEVANNYSFYSFHNWKDYALGTGRQINTEVQNYELGKMH